MSRLNKKDLELLIKSGPPVNLESPAYRYLGGPFLKNTRDYIEILIYDTNDNFLESSIVNSNDYVIESYEPPDIRFKTGTILRKMGYDRGKFVVKYRFLRKIAGGPSPLLLQNPESSDIDVKENKYVVHEISPSRKEVRLMTQNINDDKYLRDFYNLTRTTKKIRSNPESNHRELKFVNPNGSGKIIKFTSDDHTTSLPHNLIGGTLLLNNSFVTNVIFATDIVAQSAAVNNEVSGEFLEARFICTSEAFQVGNVDPTFTFLTDVFKGLSFDSDIPTSPTGFGLVPNYPLDTHPPLRAIFESHPPTPSARWMEFRAPHTDITIKSTSTRPENVPVTYTWEFFGYDRSDDGETYEVLPDDRFSIISSTPTDYTTVLSIPGSHKFKVEDSTDGCSITFRMNASNLFLGIALTINSSTTTETSTLILPGIIKSHADFG